MIARICGALALLLAPLPTNAESAPAQEIGLVLKAKGEWLLNGKTVVPGQTLPAGGKIYHASQKDGESSPFDYITIVLYDGKLESRSWDRPESWKVPIQLPASAGEAPSRWKRIVAAVMGVFPGHPEKFAQMSVRGSESNLRDAVADLKDGQVDLEPAFKRMKPGAYLLLLKRISERNAPPEGTALGPFPFNWEPGAPSPLPAQALPAGLYSLSLLNVKSEDHESTETQAWILVSDHGRYEKTADAFQECRTLTEQWGKEAPADAARSFLRAYLNSLALQLAR